MRLSYSEQGIDWSAGAASRFWSRGCSSHAKCRRVPGVSSSSLGLAVAEISALLLRQWVNYNRLTGGKLAGKMF